MNPHHERGRNEPLYRGHHERWRNEPLSICEPLYRGHFERGRNELLYIVVILPSSELVRAHLTCNNG